MYESFCVVHLLQITFKPLELMKFWKIWVTAWILIGSSAAWCHFHKTDLVRLENTSALFERWKCVHNLSGAQPETHFLSQAIHMQKACCLTQPLRNRPVWFCAHRKDDVRLLLCLLACVSALARLVLKPHRMFCKQIVEISLLMNVLFLDLFVELR